MRSTPPCALKTNSKSCSSAKPLWAEPTLRQPTGAAICPPPPCATRRWPQQTREPSSVSTHDEDNTASRLSSHHRCCCCHDAAHPSGVGLSCEFRHLLPLHTSPHAKMQETHASLPQAKRTGVWTKDKPLQDSYQAAALGAASQASCASLACHSLPRRIK